MKVFIKVKVLISLSGEDVDLIEVFGHHIHLFGIRGEHVSRGQRLGRCELDRGLSGHMNHLLLLSKLLLVEFLLLLIQQLFLMLQHLEMLKVLFEKDLILSLFLIFLLTLLEYLVELGR